MDYQKHEIPAQYLEKWQQIVDLLAKIFEVPAGLIARVLPEQIEIFVASQTEGNPYGPGEKADLNTGLYCETVMKNRSQLNVANALQDNDWKNNPDIKLDMIFYLGIPLIWPDNQVFGTICVLDNKTRSFSKVYQELLWEFKRSIENDFIIIQQNEKLEETNKELRNEISERIQAEEQIKASLKEKETLLHEIHHRVKNNMTVISSLLKLQMTSITDKKAKEALQDSQNRVQTMSMIHETLYRSDSLSAIDMKAYLSELGRIILQGYTVSSKVNLKIEAEDIMIGVKQASPLGLIVNELITNSLKYAFPDDRKGEIVLSLKSNKEKEAELIVTDNGVGIPEGFDLQNSTSLGLSLVKIIAENQLAGSIDMENTNGTKFIIKFNIDES